MPESLYRSTSAGDASYLAPNYRTRYHVTITQTGPRGGVRSVLIDATVRAEDYSEAVEYVEQEFLNRTRTEVSAG